MASSEPELAQPMEIYSCSDEFLMLKAFIPKSITWVSASGTLRKTHVNDHGIHPMHSEQLGFLSFLFVCFPGKNSL